MRARPSRWQPGAAFLAGRDLQGAKRSEPGPGELASSKAKGGIGSWRRRLGPRGTPFPLQYKLAYIS